MPWRSRLPQRDGLLWPISNGEKVPTPRDSILATASPTKSRKSTIVPCCSLAMISPRPTSRAFCESRVGRRRCRVPRDREAEVPVGVTYQPCYDHRNKMEYGRWARCHLPIDRCRYRSTARRFWSARSPVANCPDLLTMVGSPDAWSLEE